LRPQKGKSARSLDIKGAWKRVLALNTNTEEKIERGKTNLPSRASETNGPEKKNIFAQVKGGEQKQNSKSGLRRPSVRRVVGERKNASAGKETQARGKGERSDRLQTLGGVHQRSEGYKTFRGRSPSREKRTKGRKCATSHRRMRSRKNGAKGRKRETASPKLRE